MLECGRVSATWAAMLFVHRVDMTRCVVLILTRLVVCIRAEESEETGGQRRLEE